MRTLLVEDEVVTARMIVRKLKAEGIEVDWIEDGEQALSFYSYDHYDVIVLDLGLPRCDGLTVLRRLRNQGVGVPVVVLTHRAALTDKLASLDGGADDFVPKPFSFAELLARMQALTRRALGSWTGKIIYNGLVYDPAVRVISYAGGGVKLSKREGQLLELLLRERGKGVSRETILSHIWGPGEASPNSADTLARLLRQKVAALPTGIEIKPIWGMGYRLDIVPPGLTTSRTYGEKTEE